jgi:prepilin-type N-terminal cleavage/methylation domain-containing protein
MPSHARRGFTLVELLVVITIIVVLLAMLTPALDAAIYQAELASCGGSQKSIAGGIATYAFDHRRSYPYREGVRHPDTVVWPEWLAIPPTPSSVNKSGRGFDDRPMLRPYVSIKTFSDPLLPKMDYDSARPEQGVAPFTIMWAGWVYKDAGASTGTGFNARTQGMFRLGDRWTWVNQNAPANAKVFRSSIISSDYLFAGVFLNAGLVYSSHPDSNDAMNVYVESTGSSQTFSGQADAVLDGMVHASWRYAGSWPPAVGKFDLNYAREDGSVVRYGDVPHDPTQDNANRFEKVGPYQNAANTAWYVVMPPN